MKVDITTLLAAYTNQTMNQIYTTHNTDGNGLNINAGFVYSDPMFVAFNLLH